MMKCTDCGMIAPHVFNRCENCGDGVVVVCPSPNADHGPLGGRDVTDTRNVPCPKPGCGFPVYLVDDIDGDGFATCICGASVDLEAAALLAANDALRKNAVLTVGQTISVKPHKFYQHLSGGAVIDPPIERQHKGYHSAIITAIFVGDSNFDIIEVETPGGHVDLVAPEYVEVLLDWQWEGLPFLAKLYSMDASGLRRHAGEKLDARKSGGVWLSTRRAVEKYLAADGRRK